MLKTTVIWGHYHMSHVDQLVPVQGNMCTARPINTDQLSSTTCAVLQATPAAYVLWSLERKDLSQLQNAGVTDQIHETGPVATK